MDEEDKIKIRRIDNVVRLRAGRERSGPGTIMLFATHFIYFAPDNDEVWVSEWC